MQEAELKPTAPSTGASTAPTRSGGFDTRGLLLASAVLALVLGCLLSESLLGGRVLSQADALEQFAPWSDDGVPAGAPSNPVLLDQAIVIQPWMHFGAQRLQDGQLPLWNPNNYAGQPMVGTYQTAYFWPLNWVYFAAPSWSFLAWSAFARLFAAGLFTYLFLRRLRLGRAPAILGALAFGLCGFQIAWLGHMHTHVALFLPAFFWQIERIAERPSLRNNGILGLLVGGALLAGHLQTAVHLAIAVGAYALFRYAVEVGGTRLSLRGLSQVAAGATIGVLLAMPQLLPFFDYLLTSQGALVLEHVETVAEVAPSEAAVLMVDPGHHGSPAAAQGYGPYSGPSGPNLNYNELIGGYVGRLALLLALVGAVLLRRRRVVWFFGGLTLFAAAVAWQVWPVYDLVHAIPKLRSTKLMRMGVVLAFALATLGAFGLEAVLARLRSRGREQPDGSAPAASPLAMLAGAGAVLLVAIELLSFGRGYNPTLAPEELAPATAVTDYLAEQPGLWRILGIDNSALMPSANLFYDLPMLGGYDSMELRTTTELVARLSNDERGRYFIKEIRQFDRLEARPLGQLLGVRYLLSPVELPAPYELVLDGPTRIYANPGSLPRAFVASAAELVADPAERLERLGAADYDPRLALFEELPRSLDDDERARLEAGQRLALGAGEVVIESYADTEVRLACALQARGLVVLSDAWDVNWEASLDGEPVRIERVDHGLRGVLVDAGEHELVFRYRPPAILVGLGLGLAGLVAILALMVLPARERDAGPRPPKLF